MVTQFRGPAALVLLLNAGTAIAGQDQDSAPDEPPADTVVRAPQAFPVDDHTEVAYWVSLAGTDAKPVAITAAEWDRSFNAMKSVYSPQDMSSFTYRVLSRLVRQRLEMLYYEESRRALKQEAAGLVRRLERGRDFAMVAKRHSQETTTRPDGGFVGQMRRMVWRYPIEEEVFALDRGEIGGPYLTEWGAEIYQVIERSDIRGTTDEWVECRFILLRWKVGDPPEAIISSQLGNVRLASDVPRFRRLIPPAMLLDGWPASHGPDDIAPLGTPDAELSKPIQYETAQPDKDASPEDAADRASDGGS